MAGTVWSWLKHGVKLAENAAGPTAHPLSARAMVCLSLKPQAGQALGHMSLDVAARLRLQLLIDVFEVFKQRDNAGARGYHAMGEISTGFSRRNSRAGAATLTLCSKCS
jgi:hypothetical protein